jgi:hypothetical protein
MNVLPPGDNFGHLRGLWHDAESNPKPAGSPLRAFYRRHSVVAILGMRDPGERLSRFRYWKTVALRQGYLFATRLSVLRQRKVSPTTTTAPNPLCHQAICTKPAHCP